MVITKKHTLSIIVGTALLAVILFTRCKSTATDEYFYCYNCIAEHPDSGRIEIKLTINAENPRVAVHVYASKFNPYQPADTVYADTLTSGKVTLKVATDKFYSVVAYYKSGNDTIMAVDGGLFETKKIEGCQNTCWQLSGGSYDVRLKNY